MFLLHTATGTLMRVEELEELFNPSRSMVRGCDQAGEEEQEQTLFAKEELVFPSGETLPRCWIDAKYLHARPGERERSARHEAPVEMEI